MQTPEEAMAFFRARGYHSVRMKTRSAVYAFLVAIRTEAEPPSPCLECIHSFRLSEHWSVKDDTLGERPFLSLADAVNAVLARLQAWVAEHPN